MPEPIPLNKSRTITLAREQFGMSWNVPVDVALYWDGDYEEMRIAGAFGLLEMGQYAVVPDSAKVLLGFEEFADDRGRSCRLATSVCYMYNLSELPMDLWERSRKLCHQMKGSHEVKVMLLSPATVTEGEPKIESPDQA